jgi:hypothetical protein
MSKTVQSVKNSLKFKAKPKSGILSLKIGVKKYSIPVEARMLAGGGYLFLSFPALSELFSVGGGTLTALPSDNDATEAYDALTPVAKKRGRRKGSGTVEISDEVLNVLKGLPAGTKLVPTADGGYKLVKTRVRKKRKSE